MNFNSAVHEALLEWPDSAIHLSILVLCTTTKLGAAPHQIIAAQKGHWMHPFISEENYAFLTRVADSLK